MQLGCETGDGPQSHSHRDLRPREIRMVLEKEDEEKEAGGGAGGYHRMVVTRVGQVCLVWPVTRSRDADNDWDEQSSLGGPGGPDSPAVLANVWCRPCHEAGHVTRDGGSLGSVTPGSGRLGQHPERWHRERSGDPGYDTQYATLRAPGDIGQCHQRDIVTEWCNTTLQTAASTLENFARRSVF